LMLMYFVLFTISGVLSGRHAKASGIAAAVRAQRAWVVAGVLAAGTFVLMLGGYWRVPVPNLRYIELAAMMTSVPFTISVAYRLYQFPFMDVFVREVLSGVILLAVFLAALSVGKSVFWIAACTVLLAYAKEPLTRWVERTFMGYKNRRKSRKSAS